MLKAISNDSSMLNLSFYSGRKNKQAVFYHMEITILCLPKEMFGINAWAEDKKKISSTFYAFVHK